MLSSAGSFIMESPEPPRTWLLLVDHKFQAIGRIFSVVNSSKIVFVSDLKNEVKGSKSKALSRADADHTELTVWKTKVPIVVDGLTPDPWAEILNHGVDTATVDMLSDVAKLAKLGLSDGQLLFVRLPVPDVVSNETHPSETVRNEERAHTKAIEMAKTASDPSSVSQLAKKFKDEQDKRPIYNGRPAKTRGPPVTIYHNTFAELKDALRDLTKVVDRAEEKRVQDTGKLFLAATEIYESEKERCKAVQPHLENLLGIDLRKPVKRDKEFEPDAIATEAIDDVTYGDKTAVIGYFEFKNELGTGGNCGVQNVLGLRKHLAQEEYKEIRNASCCPCITVSVAGPYINIGGAILVDAFTAESFTGYIYLGGDPYVQELIIHQARIFAAVAQAFLGLKRYYQNLKLEQTPVLYRLFPSPTYFSGKTPQTVLTFSSRFEYLGRESGDYRRSLFLATYGDKDVLIKFCERYHGNGHQLVAAAGYAPELFFCEQIQGGVTMVIMEFIAGRDAYYHFKNVDLPSDILDDVKSALAVLHDADLVFGDLRRPNIVIETTGGRQQALLIDFEWVGQNGQGRYPALLNIGEITWPTGVGPHAIMRKEHDIEMVVKLNVY